MDKNRIEYIVFIAFSQAARIIGINNLRYFAKFIALIFFYLIPVRKKVVLDNLGTAFPNLNKTQIHELAFKNYYSFSITMLEILIMPYLTKDVIHSKIKCDNLDLIKEKYEMGRGVILLTAHFGNWELGAASVSSQLGIPFNVLAKPQRNPYVTKWLKMNREKLGSKEILLGISVREIIVALKNKGIVGIVGDQRGAKDSPRVKYFGKETATFMGMGAIAIKMNAPVITSIVVRQADGTYKAYFDEFKTDDLHGDDKVLAFNQKYMSVLEGYVRKYPEQWFWMHKIWKY